VPPSAFFLFLFPIWTPNPSIYQIIKHCSFLKKKKKDAPDQCGFRHLELGEYRFFSAFFNCLREGEKESACDEIAGCIATKSQFSLFFN
jgi:hypothetical protein